MLPQIMNAGPTVAQVQVQVPHKLAEDDADDMLA
jgi:hypothetical protein